MSHHFRVKLVFYKGFHAPVIVTIRTACGYRLVTADRSGARTKGTEPHRRGISESPSISRITTCKGRLQHLMQTLPAMAGQAGTETIVVD